MPSPRPSVLPVSDVTVVVPAHDEEATVAGCLRSIDRAAAAVAPVPVRVVLVLDACRDRTGDVARRVRLHAAVLELRTVAVRQVGRVRAVGLRDAPRAPGSWYATTDADSVVPRRWLRVQLAAGRAHDVFAGTVRVADWSTRSPELAAAWAERYGPTGGPADEHRHVHAANLGIRAETYWRAGGFRAVPAHEDVQLVEAARAAGARVTWSAAAAVLTSARRSARTPWGFAAYLDRLEDRLEGRLEDRLEGRLGVGFEDRREADLDDRLERELTA